MICRLTGFSWIWCHSFYNPAGEKNAAGQKTGSRGIQNIPGKKPVQNPGIFWGKLLVVSKFVIRFLLVKQMKTEATFFVTGTASTASKFFM